MTTPLLPGDAGRPTLIEGAATPAKLPEGGVHNIHLATDSAGGENFRDGTFTTSKLGAASVDDEATRDRSITGERMVDGILERRHPAPFSLLGRNIGDREIGGHHYAPNSLGYWNVNDDAINAYHIGRQQLYPEHFTTIPLSKIDFQGRAAVPGGQPGQQLTRTATGMEFQYTSATAWEAIAEPGEMTDYNTIYRATAIDGRSFLDYTSILLRVQPRDSTPPRLLPRSEFVPDGDGPLDEKTIFIGQTRPGRLRVVFNNLGNIHFLIFGTDHRVSSLPENRSWDTIYGLRRPQ